MTSSSWGQAQPVSWPLRAAERGARVLVLEKNRRPGVKILMSGGTRCNITNARGLRDIGVVTGSVDACYDTSQSAGIRAIQDAFGTNGGFLGPSLRRFDVDATVRLFEETGVATKIEGNGKIFPASDRAGDVLDALAVRLERSGARLQCQSPAVEIEMVDSDGLPDGRFRLRTADATVVAKRLIVAVGGASYPGCGTAGDGYAIARRFGHTIVEPRPALVPLRVASDWVPGLKGLSLPDVIASVVSSKQAVLDRRREAVLFAHFGLSGPAILDVSRAATRNSVSEPLMLNLDLVPALARETLDRDLQSSCRHGRRPLASLLPAELPRRLAECLVLAASIPDSRMGPDLSRDERQRLLRTIKELSLPITGTLGFERAEVTQGGVSLAEVDPRTLASRRVRGLYFAGEVLDLDGRIGGYNFQAAWSTGWLAGESAAPHE